ncbi:hypothetical protein PQ472_01250 [Lacticaseibacillus pabuli]|uniref:Uncharacterized protein n=1 Tax=Lacticaseibacillus pabuli TaxID=3025672 RepID=A0ABY7WV92_9LACO|nr:hypothetical protein [Lacticaseibacillus sp. KACC 23028]WDF82897.1 hypothetical protein PQ472_01250 [Lacticaseibacillus sp. KACC 23028]
MMKQNMYRYLTFGMPVGFGVVSLIMFIWFTIARDVTMATVTYSLLPVSFGILIAMIARVTNRMQHTNRHRE